MRPNFRKCATFVPQPTEDRLINMLQGEKDFSEVSSIIKKYLGDVEVNFKKLNKMPGDYDAYLITIMGH